MKTYSPTNFPSPKDNIFLKTTENKFIQAYSRLIQSYLVLLRHIKCPVIFRGHSTSAILRHILNATQNM